MPKIALLGMGAMGSRIAQNLIKAGYELTVYNRSSARTEPLKALGANLAPTPKAAAASAQIVISMVRDNAASREVWLAEEDGAIYGLGTDSIAIESSTLSPEWVKELDTSVRGTGAAFLEAPVVGTRPQAEAGQLIYLVGGEAAVLARVEAVLKTTAAALHHVGAVGAGAQMKLAINSLYGVQVAIWAEMLTLLEKQGIETAQAVAVLNTLPTTSPALAVAGNLMVAQNYAPLFPIELVAKDFSYALAEAQALGVATPILETVKNIYTSAAAAGYGQNNIVGVKPWFEQLHATSVSD